MPKKMTRRAGAKPTRTPQANSCRDSESEFRISPGTPLDAAVFLVNARRLRSTPQRAEVRTSTGKSDDEIEAAYADPRLARRLEPALRAFQTEQAIELLPLLVNGARSADNAAMRLLHSIAFFETVQALLHWDDAKHKTEPTVIGALAHTLLPEILSEMRPADRPRSR